MSATNSLAMKPHNRYREGVSDELTQRQKKQLRGIAQRMEAMTKVGKAGLSEAFIKSVDELLELHELVKVRFSEHKDERKDLTIKLAEGTNSTLIASIGHVIVLFRRNPDPEKRKIKVKP